MQLSLYLSAFKQIPNEKISISDYLSRIKNGYWKEHTEQVRSASDEKKQKDLKSKCTAATISGTFTQRNSGGLLEHSGYIAIDIDSVHSKFISLDVK